MYHLRVLSGARCSTRTIVASAPLVLKRSVSSWPTYDTVSGARMLARSNLLAASGVAAGLADGEASPFAARGCDENVAKSKAAAKRATPRPPRRKLLLHGIEGRGRRSPRDRSGVGGPGLVAGFEYRRRRIALGERALDLLGGVLLEVVRRVDHRGHACASAVPDRAGEVDDRDEHCCGGHRYRGAQQVHEPRRERRTLRAHDLPDLRLDDARQIAVVLCGFELQRFREARLAFELRTARTARMHVRMRQRVHGRGQFAMDVVDDGVV